MSIFYDSTTLLNKARQQHYSVQEEVKLLSESYEEVYEVDYEQLIDELLDEGYSEEEILEYLEEKMSDAEMRSLPARSRRRLGITGPTQSKKGKKLAGGALQSSLEKTRSLRQQRRASAAPTERQKKITQKSITNFISTVGKKETPIRTSAEPSKKEPKERGAFRANAKPKSVASSQTADLAKAVKLSGSIPSTPSKKEPKERGAFRSGSRPKGVASYDLTDRANAVRLAAGREFQNKAAKSGSIADLKKQYQPSVPAPSTTERLKSMITNAQKEKPKETRQERVKRLGLDVGTRGSRRKARAERAAERKNSKREVSDLKISSSALKDKYYNAPSDKTTKNREMVVRGVKGGVRKYAKKVAGKVEKLAGKVSGKVKKFFGKEDVDLFDITAYLLISEGYDIESINTILEWIDSETETEETYTCLELVEDVVDGVMVYNFMIENFEFEYEEDVYDVMEQLSIDDIEYIIESAY